jgi:hypothetical protein
MIPAGKWKFTWGLYTVSLVDGFAQLQKPPFGCQEMIFVLLIAIWKMDVEIHRRNGRYPKLGKQHDGK